MDQFTVSEKVPLRPDPDPNSAPIATLAPGDRIRNPVKLGDWSKINATDADGNPKTGWILSQFLQKIVGQTVKLHPEPLSEQFVVVTGTLETLLELANWRKVKVATDAQTHVGWIDMNATAGTEPDTAPDPVILAGDQLTLGVNEVFREALLKAQDITKIDAAALAALIDAEAAKITSGPDKGQWNPQSFNSASGATGLTQFLSGTWKDHARNATTLLNKVAKGKGLVTPLDGIVGGRDSDLLALRFDPELSIVSAAEYGLANLRALGDAGLIPEGIGDDEKARYMYLAHHEGAAGARAFLRRQNSSDFGKFVAQVGSDRAAALTAAAGGDVALAYRRWLDEFIVEHIRPAKFRKPGAGPVVIVQETKALATFDSATPIGQLGGHLQLVQEAQQALSRLGYLDPPADGRWGDVSNWGLKEFCKANGLSLTTGFTRDIARALINPAKTLPDIKSRGDWFDKVIAYMNGKGYWICRHPLGTNIVYLEGLDPEGTLNDDRPNVFNDLRVVFTIDASGKPDLKGKWEATTEPGTFWTMDPMNPGGAARIAFGQYKSWIVGTHMGGKASAHEALRQVAEITVHRDLNKDFKRTNDRTDTGLFGVNQHWGYDAPKDDLGSTSAGCLVGRTKSGHREFMALLKADPRFLANPGYKFMTAVLPADEVMK